MAYLPISSLTFYPRHDPRLRLFALWYFAALITVWWIGGILWLGFEQSWLQFLTGIGVTLSLQVFLMWVHCRALGHSTPWAGGWRDLVNFLLPAYPPGVAVVMLLFPNEQLWPIVFAATLAIGSKSLFRAPIGHGRTQHFFNPSNFGITVTLFLFPSVVGLAPPYHFTENITGAWDWIVPGVVLLSGILVHAVSTGRLPLIAAWLIGFVGQGLLRSEYFGTPLLAPIAPMTSVAFILFTLYMLPDPGTTPLKVRAQVAFGFAVAAVYGLVQVNHVLFGLVLSLTLVCGLRGLWLWGEDWAVRSGRPRTVAASAPPAGAGSGAGAGAAPALATRAPASDG